MLFPKWPHGRHERANRTLKPESERFALRKPCLSLPGASRRIRQQNKQASFIVQRANSSVPTELAPLADLSDYDIVRKSLPDEFWFTPQPWHFSFGLTANEPELFAYNAPNRADGVCLIERIDLPDGRIVIVCIAIAGSSGMSITNCVETLCFQVCEHFEVPPDRLVWIEHYDYYDPPEWNLVTFETRPPKGLFSNPTWNTMDPGAWRSLRLRPKRKLKSSYGSFESKLIKLFPWPPEAQA